MRDLVIVGGGPAGTAAAITAARLGADVLLLEAGAYPRHKVCGEFVSFEVLELLGSLVADQLLLRDAVRVPRVRLFLDGKVFAVVISPPAASLARLELDVALWQAAKTCGVDCRQQVTVAQIQRGNRHFTVATSCGEFIARSVVDASGRWSKLSQGNHPKPAWLGLKAHFASDPQQDSTDLYFFKGGYCGVQPVGERQLNVCAMVRPGIAATLQQVFARHPRLAEASRGWRQATEPLATFPLVFRDPAPEGDGVLRAGDAAAFIDPFAGAGISLALQSGALAAQKLAQVWNGNADLAGVACEYRREYEQRFRPAFQTAARFRRLLGAPAVLRTPLLPLLRIPAVSRFVVKKTRSA